LEQASAEPVVEEQIALPVRDPGGPPAVALAVLASRRNTRDLQFAARTFRLAVQTRVVRRVDDVHQLVTVEGVRERLGAMCDGALRRAIS
jgi:hypothetical protein